MFRSLFVVHFLPPLSRCDARVQFLYDQSPSAFSVSKVKGQSPSRIWKMYSSGHYRCFLKMLLESLPNCPWRTAKTFSRRFLLQPAASPSASGSWNFWTFLGISERKFGVLPAVGRFNTADTRARRAFASETSLQPLMP